MTEGPHRETIAIAADHAGFVLKAALKEELSSLGYGVLDLGVDNPEPVDYPDYANALVEALKDGRASRGVLLCGSGLGMSMSANRHSGVRAALCHDSLSARLSRLHNDANVLVMGGRMIGIEVARDCLRVFLATAFEGGRHVSRIAKIDAQTCP